MDLLDRAGAPLTGDMSLEEIKGASLTPTDDGGAIVDFDPPAPEGEKRADGLAFDANIVTMMIASEQQALANEIVEDTKREELSRSDWRESYKRGLELLGLKYEKRTEPWSGACGAFHPLMLESVIRFQSQAMTETFPASGPVKTDIVGRSSPERDRQANRVKQDMNLFCTTKMPEYRDETETMLFNLPIAGTTFRKYSYDRRFKRPRSEYVLPEHLVMSSMATSILNTDFTHILLRNDHQLRGDMKTGLYIEADLQSGVVDIDELKAKRDGLEGTSVSTLDKENYHQLYERHVDLLLDWDTENQLGLPVPYIATVHLGSNKLIGLRRNWEQGEETYKRIEWVAQHKYMPGFGAYGIGLINILGGLTESATSILRQLVDAGTLANLSGGYKTKNARIKGSGSGFKPGEWKDVDVGTDKLGESFFPLPVKEPSSVLQALLMNIVDEGRRIGSVADMKVTDMSGQNMPVVTVIAILDLSLLVRAAVQARLHASFKNEFAILADIIRMRMGDMPYEFELDDRDQGATRAQDYGKPVSVIPVSDPNATTMAQRIMVNQAIMANAMQAPDLYDLRELHRDAIRVLGDVENVDRFIPPTEEIEPRDPVTENMDLVTGRPVRAGISQDHESHIRVHMAAVEDPSILKMLEGNPLAGKITAAAAAHIMEHTAFLYRAQIEQELGVPLPPPGEPLPEDVEYQLSRLVAAAGEKLLGRRQAEAEAERIIEEMGDPMIRLQERELDIEEQAATQKYQVAMAAIEQKREEGRRKSSETVFREGEETRRTLLATQVQTKAIASNEQIAAAKTGASMATSMGATLVTAASNKAKISADQKRKAAKPKAE